MLSVAGVVAEWETTAWSNQLAMFGERDWVKRNYLVERQQGTSMAMAVEMLVMSMQSGRLQVCAGVTVAQANIMRHYIASLYGDDQVAWDLLRFESVDTLRRRVPAVKWDLYVMDYLFLGRKLDLLMELTADPLLVRQTWFSSVPPTLEYQLLLGGKRVS